MPEGDTIHKIAAFLCVALRGQSLESVMLRGRDCPDLRSAEVLGVTSKGKHLFMELGGGRLLRVHLGLYGAWHRYPTGQPWKKPARQATLVLVIPGQSYVCFNAKEVEILKGQGFQARDLESRLGPDLTRESPEIDLLFRRARELVSPETQVTDMLLDQRIASGIGNVYKSEVLFIGRCGPRTCFADLSGETFAVLYRTAGHLLRSNLGGGPRITRRVADGRGILWVYGRAGLACFRCGATLVRERQGLNPRSTYWCPGCQAGEGWQPSGPPDLPAPDDPSIMPAD
jgi:endonuclease VIII